MSITIARKSVRGTLKTVLSFIIAWAGPPKMCKNYSITLSSHKDGFSLDRVRKWWVGDRGLAKHSSEGMEEGCGWGEGGFLGFHMPQSFNPVHEKALIPGPPFKIFLISLGWCYSLRVDFCPETSNQVTCVNSHITKRKGVHCYALQGFYCFFA